LEKPFQRETDNLARVSQEVVFIAGPMSTAGEPGENLSLAVNVAARLVAEGFLVIVPQLSWIMHAIAPGVSAAQWARHSLIWASRADVILRLPGESRGADAEVARAQKLGARIYYSIETLISELRRE